MRLVLASTKSMVGNLWLLLAIVLEVLTISSGGKQTGCEVDDSDTTRTCAQLYEALESTLISNEENIFVLRKMFFFISGSISGSSQGQLHH